MLVRADYVEHNQAGALFDLRWRHISDGTERMERRTFADTDAARRFVEGERVATRPPAVAKGQPLALSGSASSPGHEESRRAISGGGSQRCSAGVGSGG